MQRMEGREISCTGEPPLRGREERAAAALCRAGGARLCLIPSIKSSSRVPVGFQRQHEDNLNSIMIRNVPSIWLSLATG